MNQIPSPLIAQLQALSMVDIAIARTRADLQASGKKAEIHKQELAKKKLLLESMQKSFEEVQLKARGEERWLRDEQQKLVDRRKGLATLNDYKLQQAAEREIEKASYQLSVQEERLLAQLEKIEAQEKEIVALRLSVEQGQADLGKLEQDGRDELQALQSRLEEKSVERARLAAEVEPKALKEYDIVRQRYAMDPIVEVKGGTCHGCHMTVPKQLLVLIAKAEGLTRCRGCARILHLEQVL